jgi:ubiquinone/menaquinone biosynthesis C-methylase UbiE
MTPPCAANLARPGANGSKRKEHGKRRLRLQPELSENMSKDPKMTIRDSSLTKAIIMELVAPNEHVSAEFERYSAKYAESAPKLLNKGDYARWSIVLDRIPDGSSLLDVGVGVGQFIGAAARSMKLSEVQGIDISRHSHFLPNLDYPVKMTYQNATSMTFQNNAFDYVTCMEVIEHLDDEDMNAVISELRRVARRGIFVTVPFCERLPLPTYHKQRFSFERIQEIFPTGEISLCVNQNNVRWALIEEHVK